MDDLDMKKKVAQEIMGLMDQMDGDRLKKHPKLMAASIEVKKPVSEMMEVEPEESKDLVSDSEEEISPEVMKKLLEMMSEKA